MRKHSVTLQGHPTSVSLEDEFWRELQRIASERSVPLSRLIAEADAGREGANLSSALRIAVLRDLKSKLGRAE